MFCRQVDESVDEGVENTVLRIQPARDAVGHVAHNSMAVRIVVAGAVAKLGRADTVVCARGHKCPPCARRE